MPSSVNASSAYSASDQWLHQLALGSRAVMETSFDLEQAVYGARWRNAAVDRPVFVCGLARAGTSLITRLIDGSGGWASLRYRDMPFVLAPNLWRDLSGGDRRHLAGAARAHDDGLEHDLETPEAIEEIFWRCFEGSRYIGADSLRPVEVGRESMEAYRLLIRSILVRSGGGRYLAKNNNSILRLDALAGAFPDAVFIHPFRNRADQARSLLNQHLRAVELHDADPFRLRYMRWLAHHEFGGDHRPFRFGSDPVGNPQAVGYWEARWDETYAWLLNQTHRVARRQVFIDYDALLARPERVSEQLSRAVDALVNATSAVRRADSGRMIRSVTNETEILLKARAGAQASSQKGDD